MAELHDNPAVELVRQAMATAMITMLEDLNGFIAKLRESDHASAPHLFWTEEAEGFVDTRVDLVNSVECDLCPHERGYDHNESR